jgi:hypothetical protein
MIRNTALEPTNGLMKGSIKDSGKTANKADMVNISSQMELYKSDFGIKARERNGLVNRRLIS